MTMEGRIAILLILTASSAGQEADRVRRAVVGMEDSDARVRVRSVLDLANLGAKAKEGVPALLGALRDPDSNVRAAAAEALWNINSDVEQVLPTLIDVLRSSSGTPRSGAARIVGLIGPKARDAVPALAEALGDPDFHVRWSAADALRGIGSPAMSAIPVLSILAAKDDNGPTRDAAQSALYVIDPETGVPELIKLIKERRSGNMDPVFLLGEIGPAAKASVPALLELLSDRGPDIKEPARVSEGLGIEVSRMEAATALGSIGPGAKEAIPVLGKLAADPQEYPGVRKACQEALDAIRKP